MTTGSGAGALTALLFAAMAAPCLASEASEPLAPLLECRSVADPTARLACFDREAATLAATATSRAPAGPAAPVTSPAPVTSAAPVTPAPAAGSGVPTAPLTSASAAAAAIPPAPAPAVPAAGSAAVAPPARPQDAKENFGLPEGAIAAQEVAAGTRAPELKEISAHISGLSVSASGRATFTLDNGQVWRQLQSEGDLLAREGDLVTISRGLLRSYWLQVKSGRGCKVTRIR
jgi:hypothetical protein